MCAPQKPTTQVPIDSMFTTICKRQQRPQKQPDKTSSGKMQKIGHKKSVVFNSFVQVRTTISLNDYRKEEIEATWYTKAEKSEISRQCEKEIDKLNRGKTLRDKKYCERGLERFITENAAERAERKARAVGSVLSLQYHYSQSENVERTSPSSSSPSRMEGDWYLIAQFYHEITRRSRNLAYEVALRDERAADKYLSEGR